MALLKRGISGITIGLLPALFGTIIFIVVVALVVNQFTLTQLDTLELDGALFTQRLLYSPHGISYQDPMSKRFYPHQIDANKLERWEELQLEEILFSGLQNQHYAAKILIGGGTYYYNERLYRRWRPQAAKTWQGGREGTVTNQTIRVLLRKGDQRSPQTLFVEVVAQP